MRSVGLSSKWAFALALALVGCGGGGAEIDAGPSTFHVEITAVNGSATLPTADDPLPANRGDAEDTWSFTIEARSPYGDPIDFDGVVRLSTRPGAVRHVLGDAALGRNVRLTNGKASGEVTVVATYGPSRLWVEDLGYLPADPGKRPRCADGQNNDAADDTQIDFPADPGCAYADDDTEEGGTFAAGVSAPVQYALPTISDIQGDGSATPYPYEAIEVNTSAAQQLVVTRVASDGFYVTDIAPDEVSGGYNSLFAFNFSTPPGMRVCDRITYLAGTVNEFFGFTELSFPSFRVSYPVEGEPCAVPEPTIIDAATLGDSTAMEKIESALVRVEGYHIAKHFGPKPAVNNVFADDASSCDFNGDGQVDFESDVEGSCANACSADPECSEWTGYSARGNYKITDGTRMLQIQTGTVSSFEPTANRGTVLDAVTGTLRNFSGGTLNWTIEARCPDDLACQSQGCVPKPLSSQVACVRLRTIDDNDQGTN